MIDLPSPLVTSSHDVRQSWCVNPIEPEHLHGLNSGRLSKKINDCEKQDQGKDEVSLMINKDKLDISTRISWY